MLDEQLFQRYTVRNGPAGCNTDLDWNIRNGFFDYNTCFTFFEYQQFCSVEDGAILYRFSPTFKEDADEYYILARSSKERKIHILQKIGIARGNDAVSVYPTETICFRSDREWEP